MLEIHLKYNVRVGASDRENVKAALTNLLTKMIVCAGFFMGIVGLIWLIIPAVTDMTLCAFERDLPGGAYCPVVDPGAQKVDMNAFSILYVISLIAFGCLLYALSQLGRRFYFLSYILGFFEGQVKSGQIVVLAEALRSKDSRALDKHIRMLDAIRRTKEGEDHAE